MAMLEVKNLGISFGGLRAVDGFEMQIEKGQLYGLIGPNGAGKTTVFNMLTGVYKPDDGSIVLDGKDITGKKTIDINKAGIARTFQNIRLFKDQSVLDNVKVGLHNHHTYSTLTGILRLTKYFKVEAEPETGVKVVLSAVYEALTEKGYNPVNQIVGYIMSGDPTYITSHGNARSLIMKVERDELVEEMLKEYIKVNNWK